jgi:tripartite-type tricarboxylate transporter receptor subunit TctC
MPEEAIAKIREMFTKTIADPDFQAAAKESLIINEMNADEYKAYLEALQKATDAAYEVAPW